MLYLLYWSGTSINERWTQKGKCAKAKISGFCLDIIGKRKVHVLLYLAETLERAGSYSIPVMIYSSF